MDYQNTLKYLYESTPMFQQIGGKAYKPGLETTHKLDEQMEKAPVHTRSQPYCKQQDTKSGYLLPRI